MKCQIVFVLFLAEVFLSCNGYEKVPVAREKLVRLDSIFHAGQINKERWAKTPRDFCLRQFPSVSNEGNPKYTLQEDSTWRNGRSITVKEEGALDDEILGQQHKLQFEWVEGIWRVTSYEVLLKRRD